MLTTQVGSRYPSSVGCKCERPTKTAPKPLRIETTAKPDSLQHQPCLGLRPVGPHCSLRVALAQEEDNTKDRTGMSLDSSTRHWHHLYFV